MLPNEAWSEAANRIPSLSGLSKSARHAIGTLCGSLDDDDEDVNTARHRLVLGEEIDVRADERKVPELPRAPYISPTVPSTDANATPSDPSRAAPAPQLVARAKDLSHAAVSHEQLHGDEIIRLLTHGPQAQASLPDPSVEAHWEDFMQRAFVMLGPMRFDALKECVSLMNAGEIEGKDVAERTRYIMGREFENLHAEFLKLLKKLGVKTK